MADTLQLWDAVADTALPVDFFDWGTVAPRSSADRAFRVRNASTLYTAEDIEISVADLDTPADPSVAAQHLCSLDGTHFTATVTLTALAPMSVSSRITIRRVTAETAEAGSFTFAVSATPATWQ